MKWRFQWLYRCGLALLFVVAFWAVWANAQGTTNGAATNAPAPRAVPHYETFGLNKISALKFPVLGEPLWKYFASLIYIVLAFYVAKLLDWFINGWLKRWAAKTETKYDDLLLELLRGPVKVIAFVIFLHIGLGVFDWPARAQVWLSRTLIVVVAASITYVALKFVDLLLGLWSARFRAAEDKLFHDQLVPLVRKSAKISLIVAAVLLTADNLGVEIKTVLAGLSIGGLALGLAAQDTVANLFGAVAIFLDKPFHIGDRVKVEGVEGTVETIGLRSTRVRNLEGHHVTIPNKTMGNAVIVNIARRPHIKTEMNIGLTYDTTAERVKRATAILDEIFRAHPQTGDLVVSFNKFNDSALNIFVAHFWNGTDQKAHFAVMQELNLQIKERFDAEKIEFAFPTQTIHLKRDA